MCLFPSNVLLESVLENSPILPSMNKDRSFLIKLKFISRLSHIHDTITNRSPDALCREDMEIINCLALKLKHSQNVSFQLRMLFEGQGKFSLKDALSAWSAQCMKSKHDKAFEARGEELLRLRLKHSQRKNLQFLLCGQSQG